MEFITPAWDMALFTLINDTWRTAAQDVLMPAISNATLLWVAALCGFGLWAKRHGALRRVVAGLLIVAATASAGDVACGVMKKEFGRLRPLNAIGGVHFYQEGKWRQRPEDFVPTKKRDSSYVSAHAANAVAAVGMAALLWPRLRLLWLLPLLIGYSRIYLGKHYPTDVLAGWLVGVAVLLVVWMLLPSRLVRYVRGRDMQYPPRDSNMPNSPAVCAEMRVQPAYAGKPYLPRDSFHTSSDNAAPRT